MNRAVVYVIVLALLPLMLWAQAKHDSSSSVLPYQNAELGFRYLVPQKMSDKTDASRAILDDQASQLHIKNEAKLLLSMSSGPNDRAVDWRCVTIVTYPRDAYNNLDDASAEAKMNDWIGADSQSGADPASGRKTVISGQSFLVSVFIVEVDGTKKGSEVWTTIRRGKLLTFAFAANSPEQLKALAKTMKTVQFY